MHKKSRIPFVSKFEKVDGDDVKADKTELLKFDFFIDPKNPEFRYSKEFVIFKDGRSEDWIKWLIEYRDIETSMLLKKSLEKTKVLNRINCFVYI
jgi:hypothetical protein